MLTEPASIATSALADAGPISTLPSSSRNRPLTWYMPIFFTRKPIVERSGETRQAPSSAASGPAPAPFCSLPTVTPDTSLDMKSSFRRLLPIRPGAGTDDS